ncbi:MAG: hypothetical protein MRECE_1c155 [Mycoplasmataceae bacterium CE_OT135]|nr:MAG: hypothetical protein MRECE_1c012 [Mycoplasmataceae bacterium CE_OT135]KLL04370.1 MAG: hypothetical protein MRECE_1c155 [Mycoplasmataceae bacterium CE_OT135]
MANSFFNLLPTGKAVSPLQNGFLVKRLYFYF